MRREMIAFGREMRGAQRVEKTLVRRAHRRGRDDGRGARGPVGRGKARAICFGKGWARQFRGRFAVVHGTHFLDIHPMRPIISDRKSVVSGKSVSVRVELGGRRLIKKKNI